MLGIAKATKKASVRRAAPKRRAMKTSLTKPRTRLKKVAALIEPAARAIDFPSGEREESGSLGECSPVSSVTNFPRGGGALDKKRN
jgi:hypothetical protein